MIFFLLFVREEKKQREKESYLLYVPIDEVN